MIVIVAMMKAVTAAAAIKKIVTRFRPWDLVILTLSVIITLWAFFLVYHTENRELQVVIEGAEQSWVFPLSANEEIHVAGPLGDTVVIIHNGAVHIHSSPCHNQLCVAMGEIRSQGQWIACLPNKVFVRIIGTPAKDSLDGSTY